MELMIMLKRINYNFYLDEPKYVDKSCTTFDILSFWKGSEFRFPDVATMARDILSIPISTVAS